MWRRAYVFLVLLRLYFALSPSYIHPDEHFQGPEVIAGEIYSYPVKLTWEFTAENPVRSIFPLWPIYGLPMLLLRSVWSGDSLDHDVPPNIVFWTLRILMFALSFVLEDWAVHELVQSPRRRRAAVLLVASSYVTWTYQTHTFSNSVETLLVAWSLVLIQRIVDAKGSTVFDSAILGFLAVFGIFNRITFPAFLLIPSLRLVPHFIKRPLSLLSIIAAGAITGSLAVILDTKFYTPGPLSLATLLHHPVITPLNNLRYNSNPINLAQHGLHPFYQHIVANLTQLLGPAYILLLTRPRLDLHLASALSGILVLSLSQHQEARFLIPAIPLILSSVRLPRAYPRLWLTAWIIFNALLGIFMGTFHQGGVIPTQLFLAHKSDATTALWWRTYTPPIWLLDGKNDELTTHDLMGLQPDLMVQRLEQFATCQASTKDGSYLVAPTSSTFLDQFVVDAAASNQSGTVKLEKAWHYSNHLNLDDLDFEQDGVWQTLKRVIGRRGLTTWRITKSC